MNRKILLSLCGSLLAGATGQAGPLTVAVYDFRGDPGAADYGGKVTALVTAELTSEETLALVARQDLNAALREQAFGISGLVSADAAAKIGQITGAKVLVAGQVMKTPGDHLVIVANIIGTETGRLFADKVEGTPDKLTSLTSDLSRKIAQTIAEQATNLVAAAAEPDAARLERLINSITGTNRPSVSITILWPSHKGRSATAEGEFGRVLLKAGFPVVDVNSDRKPDIEITGVDDLSPGPRHGGLYSFRAVIDLKVQERRSGAILAFERREGTATDATRAGADRAAQANAVDALAERVLPLLAK